MAVFNLKDSDEYYLCLSEYPKKFDADSPVTNVFFDDTNGQVFSVRSGGVGGVTVNGMDETKCTSFQMEDKGPIISIKFSPDQKILAIQRNQDNHSASVEFVNFKDSAPTNAEYSHTCKWKNAKILGFVWPTSNEIAFITDHGIELLHVLPEKKQLKSLKNISFSGAWFSWCAQSSIVLLAGNNGALLQPFSLNNSSVTKLQKLELDAAKPVVERDVFVLRVCDTTWCAVFRHGTSASISTPGPTEVWLMPITGSASSNFTHVLKTGLVGRFAVNVVDDLVVVHHQSSQTSQLFDILEEAKPDNNIVIHIPIVAGSSMKPALVPDQMCPMYSGNWVVFQPDYVIDARLGCLWRVRLLPNSLPHAVPRDEISKLVAVLLRRTEGKPTIYRMLHQLVADAHLYLVELTKAFDEINVVYRKWGEMEMARMTAGGVGVVTGVVKQGYGHGHALSQHDVCAHVLQPHADHTHIVQVVTAYLLSLRRHDVVVQQPTTETCVRALVSRGAWRRLRALLRRGCLPDARPLACTLLSLAKIEPHALQLACDCLWRLGAHHELLEVLLGQGRVVEGVGVARAVGGPLWAGLSARKVLACAERCAREEARPAAFLAVYHALQARNHRLRGSPDLLRSDQCDSYIEYYKELMSDINETT